MCFKSPDKNATDENQKQKTKAKVHPIDDVDD